MAKNIYIKIVLFFNLFRCIPHLVIFYIYPNRQLIYRELDNWKDKVFVSYNRFWGFLYLMSFVKVYRNCFYYRVGMIKVLLKFFCKELDTCYIKTDFIGEGLYIEHGFSTIISAKRIGNNCTINQQVTIGYSNETDQPTLLDNVSVKAGAKVIGNVTIGNNAVIGANAVVVKDVPDNCVVVGVPAYIIKRDGLRVNQKL